MSEDCDATRLVALTAANLGRWRIAFQAAKRYLAMSDHDSARHRRRFEDHILPTALDKAGEAGAEELEHAVDAAERLVGPTELIKQRRAFSHAIRGDVDAVCAAFGEDRSRVDELRPVDQLMVGLGYFYCQEYASGLAIWLRHEALLPEPDGLVRLAECAVGAGDVTTACRALERLATVAGPHSDVARVASTILRAKDKKAVRAQLSGLSVSDQAWFQSRPETPAPARSSWEGRHRPTSSVLDGMTRSLPN